MGDFIRRLVSGPKARFTDSALNLELDLVYITPRVIIMGYPAAGFEGLYRNRRQDAKKFLDHRHGKNYWVFNLCPLRENGYEKSVFEGRVTRFPFPDHHAPPLALLPLVAREMHAWLDGAPDRVAVIHCKAGKGRSGTVACSYLLTLTGTPNPALTAPTAAGRMHQVVDQIPAELGDQETVGTTNSETHLNRSHFFQGKHGAVGSDTKPLYDESGPPMTIVASPTVLSLESESTITSTAAAAGVRPSGANSERSFTDALKGVLDLHTSKRMKPSLPPSAQSTSSEGGLKDLVTGATGSGDGKAQKKQKQGVSIPSQRRWLYYWALILGGEEPRDIFKNLTTPGLDPKPLVRITRITVQMRELKGVKISIVRAANAVLDKAVEYKNKRKSKPSPEEESPSSSSSSLKKKKSASLADPSPKDTADTAASFAQGSNKLWASIARYNDNLVDFLEDWEAKTRVMGCSGPNHKPIPGQQDGSSIADLDGELKLLFDEEGKWDKEKMVKSFAKFGVVETAKVDGKTKKEDGEESSVVAYTLKLVSDKRVPKDSEEKESEAGKGVSDPTGEDETPEINVVSEEPTPQAAKEGFEGGAEDDFESTYSGTTAASRLTTVDGHEHSTTAKEIEERGLVVEASREVRIKLYVGQVFIGWMWFVPTFHMPQPPPSTGSITGSGDASNRKSTATLHLTRKDVDFPLGLGTAIVDVDIDMEWVSPTAYGDLDARATKVTSSTSLESQAGLGTKVGQAVAGGLGSDGQTGVGLREAVEIGQATGV